jgi:hypothetical protein
LNSCFKIGLKFRHKFGICHDEGQKNQQEMELNGKQQFLVYADDVNMLGGNINIINKNEEALLDASRKFGLGANAE